MYENEEMGQSGYGGHPVRDPNSTSVYYYFLHFIASHRDCIIDCIDTFRFPTYHLVSM